MMGRLMGVVGLTLLMVGVVACVPITPPAATPAPAEEAAVIATPEATEAAMEEMTATVVAEDRAEESEMATMVLTGTVTYLQRIALPPGSVVEVQLQDVSRQDVAATVIASYTLTTTGENVPIPFEVVYDPAQIDERMSYALSARITVDGQLRWINTVQTPVLTRGAPLTGVEVLVQPAR